MPPLLGPGGAWTGTTDSGGSAPVESGVVRGSGFAQKAIGNFAEAPMLWLSEDLEVTVVADHGDDDWIEEVEFWLEGNTAAVTMASRNPGNGAVGFSTILDHSSFQQDGDAHLYAYIRPVNGYERRLGPIKVTAIGTGVSPITRAVRYIDFNSGSDSNAGTSAITAWKSFNKAMVSTPSGGLVYCAPGTYIEDSNFGTQNVNTRLITFQPADGGELGDVVISRTARNLPERRWLSRAHFIEYVNIEFDMSKLPEIYPNNVHVYRGCLFRDPNGVSGPTYGYYGSTDNLTQSVFRNAEGQLNYLLDCEMSCPLTTGARLYRGCTLEFSADGMIMPGIRGSNMAVVKTVASQPAEFFIRHHVEDTITIATATYDGGTGRTTLTLSGAPTLLNVSAPGGADRGFEFISGPLAGETFQVYSADSGTSTVVVVGDASVAVAGDTAWTWQIYHADAAQITQLSTAQTNIDNVIFQNYKVVGVTMQPILLQAGDYAGAGTVSTSGASLTCSTSHALVVDDFVVISNGSQAGESRRVVSVATSTTATLASGFSADQSGRTWRKGKSINNFAFQGCVWDHTGEEAQIGQWQHGHRHGVMRQCTFTGTSMSFRNAVGGSFALEDVLVRDSIFERVTSDTAFPSSGLTFDNNHFETGTEQGTNSALGSVTYNVDYVPTAGVSLKIASPKMGWDYRGVSVAAAGQNLVGALATEPTVMIKFSGAFVAVPFRHKASDQWTSRPIIST